LYNVTRDIGTYLSDEYLQKVISGKGRAMPIPPKEKQYFEQLGPARVRQITSTRPAGFSSLRQIYALEWLAELDEADGKVRKADQARQTRLGQSALKTPWVRLGIAIGVAAIGLMAWLFPWH
jgi:hypothetical protein